MVKLSTKMNKRIFATIIGIAFCVTYLGGTIAMVEGLHQTTETIASSFDQGPYLVFTDEDFANSVISGERLPGNNTTFVAFCFVNVTLWDNGGNQQHNVYAVSILDPNDILGLNMTDESAMPQVLMGMLLETVLERKSIAMGPLVSYTLQNGNHSVSIDNIALYPEGSIFPDDWLIVPKNVIDTLKPEMKDNYSFMLVIDTTDNSEYSTWMYKDTRTRPTSGVIGYFEKGIYQVEDDLWSIILLTGLIISLLVYCIISIETEYQASTIRILRGIGATRTHVIKIFLLKSVFITFVGGIIGTALGFCAASAVSSISGVLGIMTFVTPVASFDSIVVPILISVGSGLVGGLWPAIRASKLFTIRRDRA